MWRSDGKMFVGHDGACPGYRTALLLMPEEKIATVFLANANGVASEEWAQRLYDIVAPGLLEAVKEPGKGKPSDPALRAYAGAYSNQPWGGETAFLPWGDGLAMLDLPDPQPGEGARQAEEDRGAHVPAHPQGREAGGDDRLRNGARRPRGPLSAAQQRLLADALSLDPRPVPGV